MKVFRYTEFSRLNEDATQNLVLQKNALVKQINDLQKKMLDVQQQITANQKATLATNPTAQVPMQENIDETKGRPERLVPRAARILQADYFPGNFGEGDIYLYYKESSEDVEEQFTVNDFEDFVKRDIKRNYHSEDVQHYFETDEDPEYANRKTFNFHRFWDDTEPSEKVDLVRDYLAKNGMLAQ